MTGLERYEIGRIKTIVGMAVSFTAMLRVFEKGQGTKIKKRIARFLKSLPRVRTKREFDARHDKFCRRFTATVRLAKAQGDRNVSYGQAAKVLDVALKACVDFCLIPDPATSQRVKPFLHAGIDTPMLKHLKKRGELKIAASSVHEINRQTYRLLQAAIANQVSVWR